MEVVLEVIDWILRITGLAAIVIILINLFIKDCAYLSNVKIIANSTEDKIVIKYSYGIISKIRKILMLK